MLYITLDKKYSIPDEWDDISFWKVLELAKLMDEKCPEPYRQMFNGEEPENISAEDTLKYLEFQISYLSSLSGIDDILIRNIRPKNGVDINWLFERCNKFLGFPNPDDVPCNEFIDVGGKKYYREEAGVDSFGNETNLQNTDFATYATGMVVNSVINNLKSGNAKTEELLALTATMFRPRIAKRKLFGKVEYHLEPYDAEKVEKRSLEFREATAADVFGAYFFLLTEQRRRLENSKDYLQKRLHQVKNGMWLKVRLYLTRTKWSCIGFWLAIPLPKKVSLLIRQKLLSNA